MTTTLTSRSTLLATLDGLSYHETYEALYDLAHDVPTGQAIVELGTYRAKSTCYLAAGAQAGHGAHVWTVDPHDLPGERTTTSTNPRSRNPLDYTNPAIPTAAKAAAAHTGLTDAITFIRGFSVDIGHTWNGPPIGLLFIDGDHREGAVRRDITAWEHHLTRDAVIAWDDYRADTFPGVVNTVQRLVDKGLITDPYLVGTLAVTMRSPRS